MQRVLDKLKEVKVNGSGWMACCPAHQDSTPSLSISQGDDGRTLLYCHAGCPQEKVVEALGLKMSDLFPPKQASKIVKTYDYTDETHRVIFQTVRKEPKYFFQRRSDGNGGFINDLKGIPRPLPLYRLPKVLGTGMSQPIYLCAGEKDADNAESLGVTATTKAGGEKSWEQVDSTPLHGRPVVILQDKDTTGDVYAAAVAADLTGKSSSVKVLVFPGHKVKDVSDWLMRGFDSGETPQTMRAMLEDMVSLAPEWTPVPAAPPTPIASSAQLPEMNDTGNALLLAQLNADRLRWLETKNLWLMWRNERWERLDRSSKHTLPAVLIPLAQDAANYRISMAKASNLSKADREDQEEWGMQSKNRRPLEAALDLCHKIPPIHNDAKLWDVDPYMLGVNNGLLDLKTGTLRPNTPADRVSLHLEHNYDPTALCPRWDRFLLEVFDGNLDLIRYVQEALGYSLTGLSSGQCFYLMYGYGSNGKSTFERCMDHVFGVYGSAAGVESFEVRRETPHTQDLQALQGHRYVTCSEFPMGKKLNTGRLKMLTGGDKTVARAMFSGNESFSPTFKLWFSSNYLPVVDELGVGFWRRLKPIPFLVQFPVVNSDPLDAELRSEAVGILRWMVEGTQRWLHNPSPEPSAVTDFLNEYKTDSDPLADFLHECCAINAGSATDATQLYAAYQTWASRNMLTPRETKTLTAFGRLMKVRFKRDHDPVTRRSIYVGVALANVVKNTTGVNTSVDKSGGQTDLVY